MAKIVGFLHIGRITNQCVRRPVDPLVVAFHELSEHLVVATPAARQHTVSGSGLILILSH